MPTETLTPKRRTTATSEAIVGLWAVAVAAFVMATLYFTREILIPLALAVLLTFLLTPLVTRLERWIGRVAAVLVVVALIFSMAGVTGWVLTRQLLDFAGKLPDYKGNIQTKLRSFKVPSGGAWSKLSETLEDIKKDLPGAPAAAPKTPDSGSLLPSADAQPVAVRVVGGSEGGSLMSTIEAVVSPLIGPLGVAALVLVLVISMLIQREDLRNRLVRLLGQGRISTTTRALDDAGERVSRYLLMQLFVNVCYGVPIAIGLYFIGVPNAMLWGALATLLRFIPFVGPWIATILPTMLAMAVSKGWGMPLMTVGLFIGLELFLNNVIEPLLYGSSTGVSSIALIVAAVFWTWLWGPVGLVLATPLTVCLVVMGRHVPRLRFLSVLLSDEQALTPAEECYQRLLAFDLNETGGLIETYVRKNSLTALYDSVLIPVVTAAEVDYLNDSLDEEQRHVVEESVGEFIEDLGTRPAPPSQIPADQQVAEHVTPTPPPAWHLHCLPVRAMRDELAGAMLTHLLREQGFQAENLSSKQVTGELVKAVKDADVDAVCISVMPPSTVIHARYLCMKLRAQMPRVKIAVGLWGATENLADAAQRLRDAGADEVVTTLADAVVQLAKLAPPAELAMMGAPIPPNETERLAALHELHLIEGGTEPSFDRTTRKLTRLFDVPIALVTLVDRDRQIFKGQTGLPQEVASAGESPRDTSVCGHVVAANETLVIEDLRRDKRFASNPLLKQHGLRFYAGVPLRAPNGLPVGSLCLLDTKPRQLSERDLRLLHVIAEEVTEEISQRAEAVEKKSAQS